MTVKVGQYVKATRTSRPYITKGNSYKVLRKDSNSVRFVDDRGKTVGCGLLPDWIVPIPQKNTIGGKVYA